MTYRITAKGPDGTRCYIDTGDRAELMDREYDRGTLVLSMVVVA